MWAVKQQSLGPGGGDWGWGPAGSRGSPFICSLWPSEDSWPLARARGFSCSAAGLVPPPQGLSPLRCQVPPPPAWHSGVPLPWGRGQGRGLSLDEPLPPLSQCIRSNLTAPRNRPGPSSPVLHCKLKCSSHKVHALVWLQRCLSSFLSKNTESWKMHNAPPKNTSWNGGCFLLLN